MGSLLQLQLPQAFPACHCYARSCFLTYVQFIIGQPALESGRGVIVPHRPVCQDDVHVVGNPFTNHCIHTY
jgi:hypothetical protein